MIEIFDRVHTSRERTIFVSQQFGSDTDFVFETIEEAVKEINAECKALPPLKAERIDKKNEGHSFDIPAAILRALEQAGLLIADLTKANPNVYHEIGYVMGYNSGRGAGQDNFILMMRNTTEKDVNQQVGFNLRSEQQIRYNEATDLKKKLIPFIRKHYGFE